MNLLYSTSGEQKCFKNRGKNNFTEEVIGRGEIEKGCEKMEKKGEGSEAKSAAALKSHSEAERRRRERINEHLTTLRGLVPPTNDKMDKATLLAQVISHVKQLKKNATKASDAYFIPLDSDEVKVEQNIDDEKINTTGEEGMMFSFRASISCVYRPGLLSDLRQAMDALNMNLERSEISTLGDRMKIVLVFNGQEMKVVRSSVLEALKPIIMDKAPEFSTIFPSKRRRVSYIF